MPTVFVDESGTFKEYKDERFFVVATFTVGEPARTAHAFRKWQQKKMPKVKRYQSEVKFSETGISDELRLKTLRYISSLDVRVRFGFVACSNLPHTSYDKNGLREGFLYTQILGEILEAYFPIPEPMFMVRCDQRQLKDLKKVDFVQMLKARLLPVAPIKAMLDVKQIDSTSDPNIQIADWIVGALAAYLNEKPLGDKYYEILKGNIIGLPVELFKRSD